MRSAKLGLLVLTGTVALVVAKINLQSSTVQAQTTANFLRIVSGAGQITRSQYPNFVPVGTSVNQVTGNYNPASRQIVLAIAGRQAELSLNSPLIDGQPVTFTVTQIIPRQLGEPSVEQFSKLVQNAFINEGVESQGTLVKKGNQILGQFTSRGKFEHDGQENAGAVTGEFVLAVQPGGANVIPQQRIQSSPTSNSPGLLW